VIFDEAIAHLLDELELGTYTPDAVGGTIFVPDLPDSPDLVMAVRSYPSSPGNAKFGWDSPAFQVTVRGPAGDFRTGGDLAQDVYLKLQGLGRRDLADGSHLLLCTGAQSAPVFTSRDQNGRPRWAVNFRAETERSAAPNRH
jgi:hypothetical protein